MDGKAPAIANKDVSRCGRLECCSLEKSHRTFEGRADELRAHVDRTRILCFAPRATAEHRVSFENRDGMSVRVKGHRCSDSTEATAEHENAGCTCIAHSVNLACVIVAIV
jgi:hypothetical protein